MRDDAIVFSKPDIGAFKDSPVRPSWVIDGAPVAKVQELSRSLDGTTSTAHWSCTAGTFHWYFSIDETVHIVEGEVIILQPGKSPVTLKPGDVALFRAGTWCVWHVPSYVRKICICRHAMPWILGFALRAVKRVLGAIALIDLDPPPPRLDPLLREQARALPGREQMEGAR
ncbi:MAG: cupin domain-containing protein [Rhabdaerophilum sp.]|jgi:uncharacterized cupin superfamily protein